MRTLRKMWSNDSDDRFSRAVAHLCQTSVSLLCIISLSPGSLVWSYEFEL